MVVNNSLIRPWSSQLEITFGCDNRCPMCYKQVLQKPLKNYDFMTPQTANEISSKMFDAGWDSIRIEFAMRGEPLLNPNFNKIIKIFRKNLPNSHICTSTNGNNLTLKKAKQYFKNGGNVFLVDCYNGNIEKRKREYADWGIRVTDYYKDDFNPYSRNNVKKTQVICLMEDVRTRSNEKRTRILHNMGGNVDFKRVEKYGLEPLKQPISRKCVKPFREIIFLYDGTIPLCCQDAGLEYKLGNIYQIPNLNAFWRKSKKLNLSRLLLYNKIRYIPPCCNCDSNGGMRIGFIPKMKILSDEEILKYKRLADRYQKG